MKRRRVISVPAKKRFSLSLAELRKRQAGLDQDCREFEAKGWKLPKSMSVRMNKRDYTGTLRLTMRVDGVVDVLITRDVRYSVAMEDAP